MKNANKSVILAVAFSLILIFWVASGALGEPAEGDKVDDAAKGEVLRSVEVLDMAAEPVNREVIISARTDPARDVDLRAETYGRVIELGVARGSFVKEGGVIARLDDRDRAERLAQAEAVIKQREMEFNAAKGLVQKGYQSETRTAEAAAQLEIARAELERIRIDLENTEIRAPFDGFLAQRMIEVGDYVQEGDYIGTFVETDPLIVHGEVTERDIMLVQKGMPGIAILPDGTRIEGFVRYVSPVSSDEIRTFPVEVEIPNPGGRIPAGITATLVIPTREVDAYRVSPAVLALNDAGDFGVKVVNEDDVVDFYQATVVKSGPDGVWLSGLPEQIRLIVNGQGFVRIGEQVEAVKRTQP